MKKVLTAATPIRAKFKGILLVILLFTSVQVEKVSIKVQIPDFVLQEVLAEYGALGLAANGIASKALAESVGVQAPEQYQRDDDDPEAEEAA